jgi:hypothetical protein
VTVGRAHAAVKHGASRLHEAARWVQELLGAGAAVCLELAGSSHVHLTPHSARAPATRAPHISHLTPHTTHLTPHSCRGACGSRSGSRATA